ncbi:MAG: FtsX-like permease family protein [Catenulispora sp.]|nr:FtsX-like permease family protein [Catenulispora sp.]
MSAVAKLKKPFRFTQGPVWRASRAIVKRRKVQTFVIGMVVCVSAISAVLGLGLLQASTGPFEHAFGRQDGAHAVVSFDTAKVSEAQLAATGHAAGVTGAAGPFPAGSVSLVLGPDGDHAERVTVVGRPQPGAGEVDRVNLWSGRWATAPGEIVLNVPPGRRLMGPPGQGPNVTTTVTGPGLPTFTVVGYAYSVSASGDAWVAPSQIAALHPDHLEMLYRFQNAGGDDQVKAGLARATAGLPADALIGFQSWRTTRASMLAKLESLLPMLIAFGVLALAVSVLIVLNVVGGAVVAGHRDIGVYKTIGFTPRQVVNVFVATMAVPAVAGTVIGIPVGNLVGQPLLDKAFDSLGGQQGISPLADVACLILVPLVVGLAAYLPARRAAAMSANAAISAGAAPRRGRGLTIQRRLAGSRLPRSLSMGLGLPFARPARSALTFAAVLLGVTTVVFANGLARAMTGVSAASDRIGAVSYDVGHDPKTPAALDRTSMEKAIRGTSGVDGVAGVTRGMVGVAGMTTAVDAEFYQGDSARMGWAMVKGHWLDGPNQIVAPARFLNRHHLALGQVLTLELDGRTARATVVGEDVTGGDSMLIADWATLQQLDPGRGADAFEVHTATGVDRQAVAAKLRVLDPAWWVQVRDYGDPNAGIKYFSTLFTVILSLVAALGVFNTVLLNTRERRRDLGMLKSIGMTPRQVVAMIVTSMGLLGLAGGIVGLPLGYLVYQAVMPLMAHAQGLDLPAGLTDVYSAPLLAWMFLAGVGIAVLGAFVPARSAARLSISEVLRSE